MPQSNLSSKTIGIIENAKNRKLIANLEKQGNNILLFPELITTGVKIESGIIERLFDFDWLIFTDLFAVDFFLQSLEENDVNFFDLDALRICAVGEAVADRLRFRQVHSDVIPAKTTVESIVSALKDYIFADDFTGLKFLLIRNVKENPELTETLISAGCDLTDLPIYEGAFSDPSKLSKLKALLKGGGVDEIIFTSPEDILIISRLFENENLAEIFSEIKITANDDVTRQTFEEYK